MNRIWAAAIILAACLISPSKAQQPVMKKETTFHQIFPLGEELPEQFSRYFIGQAYLSPVSSNQRLGTSISNVTFKPGCRNNWHSHTGGQLLLVTAGRGFYQEQGRPARELLPGDVVEIAPDVVHWHGAAPDSWFSHLAVECNSSTNKNTWLGPVDDAQYAAAVSLSATAGSQVSQRTAGGRAQGLTVCLDSLRQTDPEMAGIITNFACVETQQYGNLDLRTRILVTMASAIAQQAHALYDSLLDAAWTNGVTPVEIREVLYQAVPYVGFAKTLDFFDRLNGFLTTQSVLPPLEPQSVTTPETRLGKGLALQKRIFGEAIDRMYEAAPAEQLHFQRYLSANCFGDYQTRTGLDTGMRELLTFSMLVSMGGCEDQVKGHIRGNVNVGNDKQTLLAVVTQLLPFIGYPRALNAVASLNEVIPANL